MADEGWAQERFYHTIINARDMDETVAFYQALGFVIVRDRRNMKWPPGGGVVFGMIADVRGQGRHPDGAAQRPAAGRADAGHHPVAGVGGPV